MAVAKKKTKREGRRVSLHRPGSKGTPAKNSRREIKQPKEIHIPWDALHQFGVTAAILSCMAVFIGVVGFALMYAYVSLTTGQYFALKTLEIQGNSRLNSREILEIVHLQHGANTLALSIEQVEDILSASPWVREASVQRVLPSKLVIGIKEKSPAFWVLHKDVLHYADARGGLIAPLTADKLASLPTLEVEPGAEDSAAALPDLVRSLRDSNLPLDLNAVTFVRLSAARGVEMRVNGMRMKISIGLEEWLYNLNRLEKTLADLERRGELGTVKEIKALGANVWVERYATRPQTPQEPGLVRIDG